MTLSGPQPLVSISVTYHLLPAQNIYRLLAVNEQYKKYKDVLPFGINFSNYDLYYLLNFFVAFRTVRC